MGNVKITQCGTVGAPRAWGASVRWELLAKLRLPGLAGQRRCGRRGAGGGDSMLARGKAACLPLLLPSWNLEFVFDSLASTALGIQGTFNKYLLSE